MEDLVARYPFYASAIADALLVLAVVFLVLWLVARARGRKAARELAAANHDRLELQLTLSEQTGRLRIVGELNDLAASSVSTLARNAEGVAITATGDADAAARGAAQLADSARAALADLRRSATLAHEGETDAAQLGPAPTLDSVDELVDSFRDVGLSIEVERTGERHDLRPGAELAVYRILHEGLQNAWDHGGPGTTARVTFRWTDHGLQLLIDDDGIRAAAKRAGLDPLRAAQDAAYTREDDLAALTSRPFGRGITEMRERTELFGGVFTVTTVAGVGFSVSAIFPALRYHNGVHGVKL